MAARKVSGADRNNGKDRIRSNRSSGMSLIRDAVRGEGRIGRAGLVSELKVLINDRASGTGVAPALLAKVVPPALLR